MIADLMGQLPHTLVLRSRQSNRPRHCHAAARPAYLLLIDRESPLSSPDRRI
jgi:hypothetical protein